MFSISLGRSTAVSMLMFVGLGVMASSAQNLPETAAQRSSVASSYGHLPLAFEVNRGQTDPRVRFLARGSGYGVFLTSQEAVLALRTPDSSDTRKVAGSHLPSPAKTDVLRMQLLGANGLAEPHGVEPLAGTVNYFRGNDPSRWQSGVPTFAKVEFAGVYPGVDLVYYGNQQQLEYDFVVAPKANPEAIRLQFAGASRLQLAANGDLTVWARNGKIVFHAPTVYQEEEGKRRRVSGRFRLLAQNSVGFALGDYDCDLPLVIDPTLVYSTYLGGSTGEEALGIAVDASGNTYITGTTSSADFPVTSGSYQTAQKSANRTQAFITKLNATGTALVYSTYLGGSDDNDNANAIVVNSAGNAYVTGLTNSSDFPTTTGAFQAARLTSGGTAFIAELNTTGSALVFSTFLGGSFGGEQGSGIALDSSGNVYVIGTTTAHDFPVTPGAFATTIPGFRSAFVSKLNAKATALVYSTYLGGANYDSGNAIALDAAGNAYVGGVTSSQNFPVTPGAFQQTNVAPNAISFVSKLNPSGSALVYSTYLGGSTKDIVKTIAVDSASTVYVGGHSESSDFPVTAGAFQGAGHSGAGFVTHLNAAGSALVYSTFLGPPSTQFNDGVRSLRVSSAGEAYVTGDTLPGFPVTADAFQSTAATLGSAFITRINAAGTALAYSTCLGGATKGTFGDAIAIDAAGHAFVAGGTVARDFPATSRAFQTTNKTGSEFATTGFVAAFDTNPAAVATTTTLTSSANPATVGQKVIFDATVDASSGSTTPTGNVVFSVDGTDVDTIALNGGAASYNTSTLTAGTHTVKAAYQGDSGFSSSSASLTQTINLAQAAAPTFSPAGGTYSTAQSVTISSSTTGATIYYSIDGSAPTTSSANYTSPVAVSATETIKAIAAGSGYTTSAVASATYTIQTSAVATFNQASLDFGNQTTGTSSSARTVTLKNTGNATLTLTGFPITGSSSFTQTSTCGSSLAAGASCALAIVFTPQTTGAQSATLSVSSNTSGDAPTVALTGTGTAPAAPVVTLTPGSLAFGSQTQGSSSTAQSITVKNTGTAPLTSITVSLSESQPSVSGKVRPQAAIASANYSATTTCGSSLDVGATCTVSVVFTPTAIGSLPGTLLVTDNAANSPQSTGLSGTGVAVQQGDFTVAATTSTATIAAGGSAQFHLTVGTTGGPYNKAVTLSASGLPSGATAGFSPASVTPGSGTADSVMTIQTAATMAAYRGLEPLWPIGSPALALLFFAIPKRLRGKWSRRMQVGLIVLASLAAAAAVTGCGGGFALPRTSVTSIITVTASSGSDVHTTTVQLTVN
ncbi:DUF7948 domain-containing protein [Occallatibacter riparius]|uniref:SBBP repeat-containing protein n=1 Tax=Occallatibacter riparius TaxID=1002689 RepID=A0A9J7BHE3_9BACT|nr:SBBP repeat-containing protein [Occallatibacter riparius]UWZ81937.1 SBBP repeat-containing protein [Occallatibacter riparius]